VPFVAKARMRMRRESEIAFPLPLRERTDRAQRDQVRARESRRLSALTRRAASRHAPLPQGERGERASREQREQKERETTMPTKRTKSSDRPHTPKRLTPEQESAQRKTAFAAIRTLFCQVTQPWHSCQRGYCRRHHCCIAEAGPGACLGRHWPLMTRAEQEAAHIEVINGGPRRQQPQTHTEWSLRRFPPSNFVHG
jgi:hypothetical protein